MHHGDERGVAVDGFTRGLHARATAGIDADAGDAALVLLEPRARSRRRRVFDDGRHDMAPLECLRHTADGEIVRLRAARREDDLVGVAAEERGDLLASVRNRVTGSRAVRVSARGVAEVFAQIRQHRVDDLGQEGRRRVVVEIDGVAVVHGAHSCIQGFAR